MRLGEVINYRLLKIILTNKYNYEKQDNAI